MRHSKNIASAFVAATCISSVLAAPAPRPQATYFSDPADIPTSVVSIVGPPKATGNVRGSNYLVGYSPSNPVDMTSGGGTPNIELGTNQAAPADLGLYINLEGVDVPQPIRGSTDGPTDPGPQTYVYEKLNSDIYAPPSSDSGSIPNPKWPFGLSHNRHGNPATAGWARQQNTNELPVATKMAGVDMRLSPNAYRELHWHKANEWSLILNGSVRVQSSNAEGESFVDDLQAGDVWFFPAGIPHSIQAFESGVEFLLIFDQGDFDESSTFLASELFLRQPKEVLAKNFRTDVSSFANIPRGQLYIFPGTPAPKNIAEQNATGPNGVIPQQGRYSYHFSQQQPYEVPGGSIKIIDSSSFPIADNFAAALVTINPGAMREIHWHPTSDEWNYYLQGQARVTIFSAPESSQTFYFQAGDVGYISAVESHYIENTGTEPVIFLEMLQAPRFTDISVGQWLGLTAPQIVNDTLHLPESVIANLPKYKPYLVPGNANLSTTNFTETTSA